MFSSSIRAIPKEMLPFVKPFPPGKIWVDNEKLIDIEPKIEKKSNFEDLLSETVKKHIPKEVKWGCSLSGGIDSSIICALAKNLGYDFPCYVLDAGNSGDSDAAKVVADHLGLPLKVVKVTKEDVKEAIPILVDALATYNHSIIVGSLCTYFISKAAAKDGLKVLLFGDGADEMFAGYDRYKKIDKVDEIQKLLIVDQKELWLSQNKRLDHASMAASIEARVPFQDINIYFNSRDIPIRKKVDIKNRLKDKIILRETSEKYLPIDIASRRKITISRGTGLNDLLIEAIKEMWGKPFLYPITHKEVRDFCTTKNKIEIILFTFFKKFYQDLSPSVEDLISRKLYISNVN